MFRRASTLLARSAGQRRHQPQMMTTTACRSFSTDVPATPTEDSTFVESWKKVMPNMDPPRTPLAFMKPRPPTPSAIPSKLTVNLVLPYASELSGKEVDMVIVPATTGQMGVLPGHVPTIAELKPGVLSVHEGNKSATTGQMGVLPGHVPTIAELKPGVLSVHEGNSETKYFVSSGFVFVHANSVADIIAVEAVPVDQIDQSLVQKGLAEFTQKLNSATTELEKAEAQIGIDVHSALNAAVTG
ncbi:hypothetical protein Tsubulata_004623 [Turnera subulata]|uniref:ATP synthase F1 complex delta/epsilon subunit N-terminal domain-containing protein n=1 Tax=Turnera subulata TaxID=218843 RepID=A0A9Q0JL82_9ROSI|nr:hypothetical protein Tsubulata_004623 [Turnera subulata]